MLANRLASRIVVSSREKARFQSSAHHHVVIKRGQTLCEQASIEPFLNGPVSATLELSPGQPCRYDSSGLKVAPLDLRNSVCNLTCSSDPKVPDHRAFSQNRCKFFRLGSMTKPAYGGEEMSFVAFSPSILSLSSWVISGYPSCLSGNGVLIRLNSCTQL